MELEAVRLRVSPLYRMIAGQGDQDVDGFVVVDAETDRHLTFSLEEREARILAEAERALGICRELARMDEGLPHQDPRSLAARARETVRRATVTRHVRAVDTTVVITGRWRR